MVWTGCSMATPWPHRLNASATDSTASGAVRALSSSQASAAASVVWLAASSGKVTQRAEGTDSSQAQNDNAAE